MFCSNRLSPRSCDTLLACLGRCFNRGTRLPVSTGQVAKCIEAVQDRYDALSFDLLASTPALLLPPTWEASIMSVL
jgi:hypothetical protein